MAYGMSQSQNCQMMSMDIGLIFKLFKYFFRLIKNNLDHWVICMSSCIYTDYHIDEFYSS